MDAPLILFTLVVFAGGIISFLSPCTAVILPTFFANTFKEKSHLLAATILFFFGLAVIYIPLGLSTAFFSKVFLTDQNLIGPTLGIVFIAFGVLTLSGKSFNFLGIEERFQKLLPLSFKTKPSISSFSLGALSGLGNAPCIGPVLGVVLTLAASTKNPLIGIWLLFVYTAGLVTPLFIMAALFDRVPLIKKLLRGKTLHLQLLGKEQVIHSTNFASAILFFLLGGLFITVGNSHLLIGWSANAALFNKMFNLQDSLLKVLY